MLKRIGLLFDIGMISALGLTQKLVFTDFLSASIVLTAKLSYPTFIVDSAYSLAFTFSGSRFIV